MVRITKYRNFRGRYLIMQDDCQGWTSGDAGACASNRVAHGLRIAGITNSDANNLNVSDDPDTSGPWQADIANTSSKKSLLPRIIVLR